MTWFLEPVSPSFYVNGAVGLAGLRVLGSDGNDLTSSSGTGFTIGGGYEFARHLQLDAEYVVGSLEGGLKSSTLRIGLITSGVHPG